MLNTTEESVVLFRFIIAIIFSIGGISSIYCGYSLYKKGVGLVPDGSTVEINKIKLGLKSVGSVVLFTSVAWGYFGYCALPTYKKSDNNYYIEISNHLKRLESDSLYVFKPEDLEIVLRNANYENESIAKNIATEYLLLLTKEKIKTYNAENNKQND